MKHKILTIFTAIILSLTIVLLSFTIFTIFYSSNYNEGEIIFTWIPEESYFVDYEINGNKIKFQYSICFENKDDEETEFMLSAKFKKSELEGWIKYEKFFDGMDENGESSYRKIPPHTKMNMSFYFEGDYLGGEVNTHISFPEELLPCVIL